MLQAWPRFARHRGALLALAALAMQIGRAHV